MRVIAGSAKGHNLAAPEGLCTRPTTDRIKETLFNILSPRLFGCRFLDLYSGSGAMGIEALSRGADCAVFVDKSPVCQKVITENLAHTKLAFGAKVIQADAISAVEALGRQGQQFDVIFLDPPYAGGLYEDTLKTIVRAGILEDGGVIVAERSTKDKAPTIPGLVISREKMFKTTTMTFMTLEGEEQ